MLLFNYKAKPADCLACTHNTRVCLPSDTGFSALCPSCKYLWENTEHSARFACRTVPKRIFHAEDVAKTLVANRLIRHVDYDSLSLAYEGRVLTKNRVQAIEASTKAFPKHKDRSLLLDTFTCMPCSIQQIPVTHKENRKDTRLQVLKHTHAFVDEYYSDTLYVTDALFFFFKIPYEVAQYEHSRAQVLFIRPGMDPVLRAFSNPKRIVLVSSVLNQAMLLNWAIVNNRKDAKFIIAENLVLDSPLYRWLHAATNIAGTVAEMELAT